MPRAAHMEREAKKESTRCRVHCGELYSMHPVAPVLKLASTAHLITGIIYIVPFITKKTYERESESDPTTTITAAHQYSHPHSVARFFIRTYARIWTTMKLKCWKMRCSNSQWKVANCECAVQCDSRAGEQALARFFECKQQPTARAAPTNIPPSTHARMNEMGETIEKRK